MAVTRAVVTLKAKKKKGWSNIPTASVTAEKLKTSEVTFSPLTGFTEYKQQGLRRTPQKGTLQSYEGCAPGKTSLKQRNQSTNNSDRCLEILRIWQPPCVTKVGQIKQDVNAQKLSTGTVRGSRDCKENTREPKKVVPVTESTPDMRVFHLCTSPLELASRHTDHLYTSLNRPTRQTWAQPQQHIPLGYQDRGWNPKLIRYAFFDSLSI